MTPAARAAITESIAHDRIVHLDWDPDTHEDLALLAEGSADTDTEHEFWGTTGGHTWRVHVRKGGAA